MPKNSRSSRKRLLKQLGQQKGWLVLVSLITLIQVLLTIYLPVLIGQSVDAALHVELRVRLMEILLKILGVTLLNTLVQWLAPLIYQRLIYQLTRQLRQDVLNKIHHLPLAQLDQQTVGDLVARVTTDTEQLTNGLLMCFNQFLVGLLTILLTIVSMTAIDPLMMLMVIALTPLSLFMAKALAQHAYRYYRAQTQARGQQVEILEEALRQTTLIQYFNAQDQVAQRFFDINATYADQALSATFISSIVNPITRFINALIYALLASVGAYRIIQGAFTVGQLTTFLNYATQYTKPFNDISSVLAELQSALACADRLYELLDQPDLAETGTALIEAEAVQGHFQFKQVAFGYQANHPIIQDLNLDIPAGSKVAIVGPTGAGKSTLINLIMRFYEVNQGQIELDGLPITQVTRASLRQQIGMVLQDTWLKAGTIHENIAYGHPDASRAQVVTAAKAANADFFIQQLPQGYDTYLKDAGASLSQGQRQLLTIARLFVQVPKILILDEATSSIDTRTELLIQDAFERLMVGRTSFIIAHRLSTIQQADLILVMVKGQIVEQGQHQDLMATKGIYYQMQTAQGAVEI